jgi:hypothetical protein
MHRVALTLKKVKNKVVTRFIDPVPQFESDPVLKDVAIRSAS